jgi:hypothetical protein
MELMMKSSLVRRVGWAGFIIAGSWKTGSFLTDDLWRPVLAYGRCDDSERLRLNADKAINRIVDCSQTGLQPDNDHG